MKIGIDISQIVYGTGVSKYTEELVKNLLQIDKKNYYFLFFSSLRQKISNFQQSILRKNLEIKNFKLPPSFLEILWNRLHMIKIENFIGQIDIFHSSDWLQPPAKARKITTIHDVSFLHYPQSFPKKIIEVHQRRLKWVKRECDLIIADSKATKKDLVNLLGFDEKKIRVVYLGVNKLKIQTEKTKTAIKNFKLPDNYFLYLGTLEPRKNLKLLIEAFKLVRKEVAKNNFKLIIAGKKGWLYEEIFKKVKELKLEDKVIFTGYVSEEEKLTLLSHALAFVYPSLYEGFGIPVLEAMAVGCPVVTSKVSSLPEITGKAALLVDPTETEEIAFALQKLILNQKLRQELSEKGKKQAEKFTWQKTAAETLKIYQELC